MNVNNKKILIVLTNTPKYDKHNVNTGLWLGELTHFYNVVVKHGYQVDFLSPLGGEIPLDPISLKLKGKYNKYLQDQSFINLALKNTKAPNEINPDDYAAIYYTGGHGVMWDFPDNKDLQNIALQIYANGGYITAVCHGVVGLLNLQDQAGNYLVANKSITGFSNIEEYLINKHNKVPFFTEDEFKKRQAIFKKTLPFLAYAIQDGRIITGQNPASPKKVAKLLITNLTKHTH
ncbi:type 1 glutamine amidotransferase domain-containing protein [Candidatus Mycoplasma pogonae]